MMTKSFKKGDIVVVILKISKNIMLLTGDKHLDSTQRTIIDSDLEMVRSNKSSGLELTDRCYKVSFYVKQYKAAHYGLINEKDIFHIEDVAEARKELSLRLLDAQTGVTND